MFTGLIEKVCVVESVSAGAGGVVVCVELGVGTADEVEIGESIAVNGVCLTVRSINGGTVCFDVSGETVAKSTLGGLKAGERVNIERAMRADSRFGGHFVQGHADGTAKIRSIREKGDFYELAVSAPGELSDQLVGKGSVSLDGISLTVAGMKGNDFTVAVIPQTWENTNLRYKKAGDEMNIETDIIAKLVSRQLGRIYGGSGGMTVDKLREMGF